MAAKKKAGSSSSTTTTTPQSEFESAGGGAATGQDQNFLFQEETSSGLTPTFKYPDRLITADIDQFGRRMDKPISAGYEKILGEDNPTPDMLEAAKNEIYSQIKPSRDVTAAEMTRRTRGEVPAYLAGSEDARKTFTDQYVPSAYFGRLLVDGNNQIARDQYDIERDIDARSILHEMSPAQRRYAQKLMRAKGFYGDEGSPSSNGTLAKDITAMKTLLATANAMGRTWDVALSLVLEDDTIPVVPAPGGGGGRQLAPDTELELIFARAAHETLGRKPTAQELNAYIRAYKADKTDTSPSALAAKRLTSGRAGLEAKAYGMAGIAQMMQQMLGGR